MSKDEKDYKQMNFEGMAGGEVKSGEGPGDPGFEETAVDRSKTNAIEVFKTSMDLDMDDVFWPRLRLAQGLSDEVQAGTAKPGQWVMAGQEPSETVTIVPVAFAKRRELVDNDAFIRLCYSNDGLTGIGSPGGDCSVCPMTQWAGTRERREPPKCSLVYSYLVYVVEYETVAQVDFKKTGSVAGKMLNTLAANKGLGNYAATLGSRRKQNNYGSFFIPSVVQSPLDEATKDLVKDNYLG
jgi:hypothetical protein